MNGGMYIKPGVSSDEFIRALSSASIKVALKENHQKNSFVELELGLWEALREVIRKNMFYHPYPHFFFKSFLKQKNDLKPNSV